MPFNYMEIKILKALTTRLTVLAKTETATAELKTCLNIQRINNFLQSLIVGITCFFNDIKKNNSKGLAQIGMNKISVHLSTYNKEDRFNKIKSIFLVFKLIRVEGF